MHHLPAAARYGGGRRAGMASGESRRRISVSAPLLSADASERNLPQSSGWDLRISSAIRSVVTAHPRRHVRTSLGYHWLLQDRPEAPALTDRTAASADADEGAAGDAYGLAGAHSRSNYLIGQLFGCSRAQNVLNVQESCRIRQRIRRRCCSGKGLGLFQAVHSLQRILQTASSEAKNSSCNAKLDFWSGPDQKPLRGAWPLTPAERIRSHQGSTDDTSRCVLRTAYRGWRRHCAS